MSSRQDTTKIPLPRSWKTYVRSAVLHVLSLVQCAAVCTRGWAANPNSRIRQKAGPDRQTPAVDNRTRPGAHLDVDSFSRASISSSEDPAAVGVEGRWPSAGGYNCRMEFLGKT